MEREREVVGRDESYPPVVALLGKLIHQLRLGADAGSR